LKETEAARQFTQHANRMKDMDGDLREKLTGLQAKID
jgi:hypothetical protein